MAGKVSNRPAGTLTGNCLFRKEHLAFTEGRKAKIDGLSAIANPHQANSPASVAWLNGHSAYVVAGTATNRDMSADIPKV